MRSGHSNVIRNVATYSCCSVSHFFSTSLVSMFTVTVIHTQRMSTSVIVRSIIGILSDQKMTIKTSLSLSLFQPICFQGFCLSKYLLCFQLAIERFCRMNYILLVWIFFFLSLSPLFATRIDSSNPISRTIKW